MTESQFKLISVPSTPTLAWHRCAFCTLEDTACSHAAFCMHHHAELWPHTSSLQKRDCRCCVDCQVVHTAAGPPFMQHAYRTKFDMLVCLPHAHTLRLNSSSDQTGHVCRSTSTGASRTTTTPSRRPRRRMTWSCRTRWRMLARASRRALSRSVTRSRRSLARSEIKRSD